MTEPINKQMGDYQILKTLGSGGMGRVYQVRNTITDRVEAMKVLLPNLEGHEDVAARFQREIKVLAALSHPNIATLHTALVIDNQLVMIMEYVEGQSLSARLSGGALEVLEALNYLDQVLAALAYAHSRHVVHRDIKPANMMVTTDGVVKLMDFGIARSQNEPNKLTATGSTLGSLNYMSPEQINGKPADARSDLYSLGISLYEMVTGQRPFKGDSNFSIMAAHLTQAPKPPADVHPGLPGIVNDLILTAISKAPEHRYQTAESFRRAVQKAQQQLQQEATLVQGSRDDASLHTSPATTASRTPVPAYSSPSAAAPVMTAAAAATAVAASPVPAASAPVVASAQARGNRGLYMALGALLVVAALVATAIYLPQRKKASAAEGERAPAATQPSSMPAQPATAATAVSAPATQQPASSAAANGAENNPAQAGPTAGGASATLPAQALAGAAGTAATHIGAHRGVHPKKLLVNGASAAGAASADDAAAAAAKAAELDALEHDIDQLTARAAAVNSSLDTLARQQAAAGYGLRGDIAARQASMKVNLAKAQDAAEHNDAPRARRYADLAAADADALERFLGR